MASKYLESFFEEFSFPEEAREAYRKVGQALELYPIQQGKIDEVNELLFATPQDDKLIISILNEVADKIGIPQSTFSFYVLAAATERLMECYREMGLPERVAKGTLKDFKAKDEECYMYTGVHGSFSTSWLIGWFKRERFAFGRLQFNPGPLQFEEVTIGGKTFRRGDEIMTVHIPRLSEPFTPEARRESYKEAYEFFKHRFADGIVPFTCSSWLLFPYNREILKPTSNVITFADEYKLMTTSPGEVWIRFIFGTVYTGNPDDLPEESSLHRGYKKYLKEGNMTGSGYGIFLYDGKSFIKE